jgi:hypothetical protein
MAQQPAARLRNTTDQLASTNSDTSRASARFIGRPSTGE